MIICEISLHLPEEGKVASFAVSA